MTTAPQITAIHSKPKQTTKGPVRDFLDCVKAEQGTYRTGHLYGFGPMVVSFFQYRNQIGARFYRPIKNAPGKFHLTEVSSTGQRAERGTCRLSLEPLETTTAEPQPKFNPEQFELF